MYNAICENWISEEKAIELVGKEAVEAVKSENCEFTNRVIDDCFGVEEMSASIDLDCEEYDILTIYYLVSKEDLENCKEDLGNCNYEEYFFDVN